ncbi:MAG: cryptochrome/photolyase family protein [Ruegeria sp.]
MPDEQYPIIVWFRRDLRLSDHPALFAAAQAAQPIIPVFIRDASVDRLGAAPKWRLGRGLEVFQRSLKSRSSRIVLRSGNALDVLQQLVRETGARNVYWTRAYDPEAIERDTRIKIELSRQNLIPKSFDGHLLFEPWTVATRSGQPFRVFTPMWRAVHRREVSEPLPAPSLLPAPQKWPASENLENWKLGHEMVRGGSVVDRHVQPGEAAAQAHLDAFVDRLDLYSARRDQLGEMGTSRLSEYLALGEISPRKVWHRVQNASLVGTLGADVFLRQLAWREFAYQLMFHTPHLLSSNWKSEWTSFPWSTDAGHPVVSAWRRGRTGVPVVDAGLRQMYVTGRMHNRARMIVASYLTKHLMTHWRLGMDWFADCLVDWDPASNAMGWQWVAGSGPDASPFFRIFNPQRQAEKFDPSGSYVQRWVAEGQKNPPETALAYFDAIPLSWGMSPADNYPHPMVNLKEGRLRALDAYQRRETH